MDFNWNNIFTLISTLISGIFSLYCILKIKPHFKKCVTYNSPSGSESDYSIFRDCALRVLLMGGSIFLFLHAMYFGITDEWLLPYQSYMKSTIIVIGAIYYIFNIFQTSINFVNNEIKKKIEVNNSSLSSVDDNCE